MKKQLLLIAMFIIAACSMTGCATAITSYHITNGQIECPPRVIADTSTGVSVHVNENITCEQDNDNDEVEVQNSD